jgi:glycosyltransferase involved in cell wall biosynthesis
VSRSLLLVSQHAPPSGIIAARRIGGLAKYLGRAGFRVTVLTSRISGEGPIDGAERVVRTRDLFATQLNWRRRSFDAMSGVGTATYSRASRLESVAVPDLGVVGWLPFALPAALRLARNERFDCVLTSSPPQSAHLIGRALKRRGLPWIAELRDGWTFDPPRPAFPTGAQRRLDERLERSALGSADAVIGISAPLAEDAARRFGVRAEVITNAFDPEEAVDEGAADGLLRPGRHSLVHTGRMAVSGRSPTPLLEAVGRLDAELAARLDVVFAGPLTQDERELIESSEARWVGSLGREQTLALQRRADTLLVLARGASGPSVATGKLFEYLGAGRPILVLGEATAAAEIVRFSGAGLVASATDPAEIAAALERLVTDPPAPPEPAAVEPYAFPAIAERLGALVEEVVSRRAPAAIARR